MRKNSYDSDIRNRWEIVVVLVQIDQCHPRPRQVLTAFGGGCIEIYDVYVASLRPNQYGSPVREELSLKC